MKWILGTVLSLALITMGCADPVAPVTPTPVAPTITETFIGTLTALGSNTHPFAVQQVGGLTVRITDITPSAAVSLGIGVAGLTSCSVVQSVTAVSAAAPQISGTASIAGNFCVSVADPGNLVETITYTVVVQHS
jgi:hypothetical protein